MADMLAIFERTISREGTRVSKCPTCHRKVYTGRSNYEMKETEDNHICDHVIARLIRERMQYGTTFQ
jgi:hypothetical protein